MVDWDRGHYERTARQLEPVAEAVVAAAAPAAGDRVLDVACGTGNAALLAGARGADVVGIDVAERLIGVARRRAAAAAIGAEFVVGDVHALPVADASFDIVLSVFGLIFASDPGQAIREVARVLRPDGRAYVTAWVPSGPMHAMLTAFGRVFGRVTDAPAADRFAWWQVEAVGALAAACGLRVNTVRGELAISATSPEAYVDADREHPMGIDAWPRAERAGLVGTLREEMIGALAAGNEDPGALLIHSPYVIHELRPIP
ncbi:MAG TPA: class I SAM-dependent methyltransferase [Solirubrobacteraceae bacterium]|jgi:SAM-dependent methyltransferase|nr:class I SAM-dependent methyltransferase [Solirubrobacteraceae bacterium]